MSRTCLKEKNPTKPYLWKKQLTEPKRMPFIQPKAFPVSTKGICMCIYFFQSNSKLKLVRSLAVCEESSAPFADGPPETQVGPL